MCQCAYQPVDYSNPAQVEMDYGMDMRSEKYHDGYMRGLLWDANWMPGGPWVYNGTKLPKLAADNKREHEEWQAGFRAGLDKTLSLDPVFAAWWNTFHGKHGHHRYPVTGEFSLHHVQY